MTQTGAMRTAAVLGFLGVALGAFGAHGLKQVLETNGSAETWRTAVFYHLVHTIMLFLIAPRWRVTCRAGWSFLIGVVLFSGSLYLYALTKAVWLAMITPLGGLCFLLGWLWLAIVVGRYEE
jgi:uncharacterized membrane protein YgdD (TMEM256/DUF423 family)